MRHARLLSHAERCSVNDGQDSSFACCGEQNSLTMHAALHVVLVVWDWKVVGKPPLSLL